MNDNLPSEPQAIEQSTRFAERDGEVSARAPIRSPHELDANALYRKCIQSRLPFTSTDEIEPPLTPIGHSRALTAMHLGTSLRRDGYNLFVMGPRETGLHRMVAEYLVAKAGGEPTPPDLIYVNNFREPGKPLLIMLPPGKGAELRADLKTLVHELGAAIPSAFESTEYKTRKQAIEKAMKNEEEGTFEGLRSDAANRGFAFLHTPFGFSFAPLISGEVATPEAVEQLPSEEKERLAKENDALFERLRDLKTRIPELEKELHQKLHALIQEVALRAVANLIEAEQSKYAAFPVVVEYFTRLQEDVLANVELFLSVPGTTGTYGTEASAGPLGSPFQKYQANLVRGSSPGSGAPVTYEDNPTLQNLVGRTEHLAQFGALVTDFSLIRGGAMHRAQGGYLILDADKVLSQPYAWYSLKRSIQARQIQIESFGQLLGLVSTVSLEPEPVAFDAKVVLVGDRYLYYLLAAIDPDLHSLFKVVVDFDDDVPRTDSNEMQVARWIAAQIKKDSLRPFTCDGVACLIEHSARLAEDSEKLSMLTDVLADVMREADFAAASEKCERVGSEEVALAIEAKRSRENRIHERILEAIRRDTLLIDVAGDVIGQINALSLVDLGASRFAYPSRVTAKVRLGKGEVVDIERQTELGGPIHSKGVLILAGFLGSRYGAGFPLSLSASLVFEQSYGAVEGDSASAAELFALLSALAQVPIRQGLAVTGSINQQGQVQSVGGINEKIEGFFDVCREKGLTGQQGVVIPRSNTKNLMLREDVGRAVAAGRFHVFAIAAIDQGIELLTGITAGARDPTGRYPAGTFNALVDNRVTAMGERLREILNVNPVRSETSR